MKIVQRPVTGLVAVVLGLLVLFYSVPLLMLEEDGRPWTTSIINTDHDPTTVEIEEENGARRQFTGTPAEARQWREREEDKLMTAYGIPGKIATGEALAPVGLTLVLAGLVQLLWCLLARVRSRDHIAA